MLHALSVRGYRSVRAIDVPLSPVTVVVGANGTGKTNLYRALYLLHAAARGELARTIADEGGMGSVTWAGERKKGPVRTSVSIRFDPVEYDLELGLPAVGPEDPTAFVLDPVVKSETIAAHVGKRRTVLFERGGGSAWGSDDEGRRVTFPFALFESESVLSQISEPHKYPELSAVRQRLMSWRFYHHFRTDPSSPIRSPQVGVRTVALAHDGADLAAALQTIFEIGDGDALGRAVMTAFPGASLDIDCDQGRFAVRMRMPGLRRALDARELSDGTLRYLCLLAALHAPRAPTLLALNEPETSLHPSLLPALGEAVAAAAARSQIWVTTHSTTLARAIGGACVTLTLREGATTIVEDASEDD